MSAFINRALLVVSCCTGNVLLSHCLCGVVSVAKIFSLFLFVLLILSFYKSFFVVEKTASIIFQ